MNLFNVRLSLDDLVVQCLKLLLLALEVRKVDAIVDEIIQVTVELVELSNSLVTFVLSDGLECTEDGRARIVEEDIELLKGAVHC